MGHADLNETAIGAALYHRDKAGVVHVCRRAMAGPGKYLVWTDCLRDVPPERAFAPSGPAPAVTCPRCQEGAHEIWELQRNLLPEGAYR